MAELTDLLITPVPAIERVALAIAADAYPGLEPWACVRELDRLALPMRSALAAERDLPERVAAFVLHVFAVHRFRTDDHSQAEPRSHYLNEVLDRRVGSPVLLAIVLMALGRRVGLALEPLGLAGRLLLRLREPAALVIDPAQHGRLVAAAELAALIATAVAAQPNRAPVELVPIGARQIALRVLRDLQHAYEQRAEHGRALVVCDRLVDLSNLPVHRRDRGLHALALGALRAAAEDFEAYLTAEPNAPDAADIHRRLAQALAAPETGLH